MLSLDWRPFDPIEKERIAHVKSQFHVAIQNVAAVGRRFLSESKTDENATLFWIPGLSRLAGHWVEGNVRFRSSISFVDFKIYLVDHRVNTISSFEINGATHRQVMLWLEEQIGILGLSASTLTLNLPYEIKNYPQLNGTPFDLDDPLGMDELSKYYHNSFLVLRDIKQKLQLKEEINIWPHHFDAAMNIILKNSGDPETDTMITMGMSPGDDHHQEPYFYVSSWPHVHTSKLKPLDGIGNWVEDDWTGAILNDDDLQVEKNQKEVLSNFYEESFQLLAQTLTK